MSRLISVLVCVYILFTCAMGTSAEPSEPIAPNALLPIHLATVGQTQVLLHDVQPADRRLVLEIRGPDVTSMPARSTLHVAFDTWIAHVTEPRAPMPLRLETAVANRQVTFFLARDPFALPQPWSYIVAIAFNQLPRAGTIVLGNLPPHHVAFPSASPAVRTLPGT